MYGSLAEMVRLKFHEVVGISLGEEGRGWHWDSDQETMLDLGGCRAENVSMHASSYQTVKMWFFFMYAPLLSRGAAEF